MRIGLRIGATAALLAIFGGVMAAEPQQCRLTQLPVNVDLPRNLEQSIRRIYDRSATFRAQCERIARAHHLRIRVRLDTAIPHTCRAFTVVQRRPGKIDADVHLPPSADHSELLAHEFEHLLEQLEGIDLRRLARVKRSGVREIAHELFETDRAQAVGRIVAAEAGQRPGMPAAD
jgi:hypothetical protein